MLPRGDFGAWWRRHSGSLTIDVDYEPVNLIGRRIDYALTDEAAKRLRDGTRVRPAKGQKLAAFLKPESTMSTHERGSPEVRHLRAMLNRALDDCAAVARRVVDEQGKAVKVRINRDRVQAKLGAAPEAQRKPVAQYSDIVSDGGLDPRNKFDAAPEARALRPLPFSNAELERLYANIPPTAQQDARSREAFKRLARIVEAGHGITGEKK